MSGSYGIPTDMGHGVLIASSFLTHPRKPMTNVTRSESVLRAYRVGTIVNVASDVEANDLHLEMYRRLGITYYNMPIDDVTEKAPPAEFFELIRAVQREHENKVAQSSGDGNKTILFNCQMGINRSALAAFTVLRQKTSLKADELLVDMRQRQHEQRSLVLLTNPLFVNVARAL